MAPSTLADAKLLGASALSLSSVAQAEAARRMPNAGLYAVSGFEVSAKWPGPMPTDDQWPAALNVTDPALGDGLHAAWVFGYANATEDFSRDVLNIIVAANGTVMRSEVSALEDDANPFLRPIGSGVLDSEAAWARARTNASLGPVVGNDTLVTSSLLFRASEKVPTVWVFFAGTGDESFVNVLMDATTGDFLDFDAYVEDAWPSEEQGNVFMEATIAAPDDEDTFEVLQDDHPWLVFTVDTTGVVTPPLANVKITVTPPEGAAQEFTWAPNPLGGPEKRVTFDEVPAGTWRVTAELTSGVRTTFAANWCAWGVHAENPDCAPE